MKIWKKLFNIGLVVLFLGIIFWPTICKGLLPIPADTIVGMYYPWKDTINLPFKNFLITDPVRQLFVWRQLALSNVFWNPYSFSGTPLLANFQSAVFYPLNIVYLFGRFSHMWSLQVFLQSVLGAIFMALFLKNLKLKTEAVVLGTMAWIGSGFFVAWFEWNTLVQAAIWLPLVLLSIDKKWWFLLIFSLTCSFLAGSLQIFFYVFVTTMIYSIFSKKFIFYFFCFIPVMVLTFFQWWPTWQFIQLSARNVDQSIWQKPDWFLPWQNLVQFIAPDYFGNPATGNYFGVWNYGEFVGYVGIIPLFFVLLAFTKKSSKTLFFMLILIVSFIFALPTGISSLPFILKIPFISTAQPSRLLVLIDFSLSILAAIGLNNFLNKEFKYKKIIIFLFFGALTFLWILATNSISFHNLILPTIIFIVAIILLKPKFIYLLLFITVLDLARFFAKYESFSPQSELFPKTKIISFLQENTKKDYSRIASADDRIMPPNFSVYYRLYDIGGYDPLYLSSYSKFIARFENRDENFNRIITPKNYSGDTFDLLGVKYVLSLNEITDSKYKLILSDGQTKVYENLKVRPRAFFADNQGLAKIISYKENEVLIETENDNIDTLVLTDVYYPNWKAKVDEISNPVTTFENVFRAVKVPSGKHIVRFYYAI